MIFIVKDEHDEARDRVSSPLLLLSLRRTSLTLVHHRPSLTTS
jgi:hypothetical protein